MVLTPDVPLLEVPDVTLLLEALPVEVDPLPVDVEILLPVVVVGFEPGVPVDTGVVNVPVTVISGFSVVLSVVPSVVDSVVVSTVVPVVVKVTKHPKIFTRTFLIGLLGALSLKTTLSTGLSLKSVIGVFVGCPGLVSTGSSEKYVSTVKSVSGVGVSTSITPTRPTVSGLNGTMISTVSLGKLTPASVNNGFLSLIFGTVITFFGSTSSGSSMPVVSSHFLTKDVVTVVRGVVVPVDFEVFPDEVDGV